MEKTVITVSGKDQKGIVATVSLAIARCGGNILDLTQKLSGDIFVMLVIVDLSNALVNLEEFQEVMARVALTLGVVINVQHHDVFQYMHRLNPTS